MTLRVLVSNPGGEKFFVDLVASASFVKEQHPELALEVFSTKEDVPKWWSSPGEWLKVKHQVSDCQGAYDLIIQTTPNEDLARDFLAIDAENRTGIVSTPNLHVQGRWAQTLVVQLGARRFSPFAPFDLFNHVLLGRTTMNFANPKKVTQGLWIVDLDSLNAAARAWGEDLISKISLTHPGQVRDKIPVPLTAQNVSCYIGANEAAASWLSYHGTQVALLNPSDTQMLSAPSNINAWIIQPSSLPSHQELLALFASPEGRRGKHYRYTTEYLGGMLPMMDNSKVDDTALVFDRLHYVVFNYMNDLLEVDLPIPEVTPACCLKLKGIQSIFSKLSHLNQFGIKFLQEFVAKIDSGEVKDSDLEELSTKVAEIDSYTEKTLGIYPELDLLKLWLQFTKAGAQGDNILEISKSFILIFHEANQAMAAYTELIEAVVKRHTQKQDSTGP